MTHPRGKKSDPPREAGTNAKEADNKTLHGKGIWVQQVLLTVGAVFFVLVILELGLRLKHYRPNDGSGHFHSEQWATPDQELGWRMTPGIWNVDILSKPMTVQADGSRLVPISAAVGKTLEEAPVVLLLGGSYMLGYGVEDDETIAAVLQGELVSRNEQLRVVNRAVPGYGTWQSYLMLKRYLEENETPPAIVVYGYAVHHRNRNICNTPWIRSLASYKGVHIIPPHLAKDSEGKWIQVPYSELNLLGLADNLDLVYFIQDRLLDRFIDDNSQEATAATCYSIERMNTLCRQHGIEFMAVNIFGEDPKCEATATLPLTSCALPIQFQDPKWFLKKDDIISGHPNAAQHAALARCIANRVSTHEIAECTRQ